MWRDVRLFPNDLYVSFPAASCPSFSPLQDMNFEHRWVYRRVKRTSTCRFAFFVFDVMWVSLIFTDSGPGVCPIYLLKVVSMSMFSVCLVFRCFSAMFFLAGQMLAGLVLCVLEGQNEKKQNTEFFTTFFFLVWKV